jgi:hypothetical protein
MNEATTIARTPRTPQAPNTDVLFLPYRPRPSNLRQRADCLAACYFEVAEALIRIWGRDRIGVRLSPIGKMNDIHDDQPEPALAVSRDTCSRGRERRIVMALLTRAQASRALRHRAHYSQEEALT